MISIRLRFALSHDPDFEDNGSRRLVFVTITEADIVAQVFIVHSCGIYFRDDNGPHHLPPPINSHRLHVYDDSII